MDMKFTKETVQKTLLQANSKTEWSQLLGFKYFNGKVSKLLGELLIEFNLNIDHFDRWHKNRKWAIINKICPVCNKSFETKSGHPKEKTVCSYSCSNTYFASIRHTEEANEKTSKSITKYLLKTGKYIRKNAHKLPKSVQQKQSRNCKRCNKSFFPIRKSHRYCSKRCGSLNRVVTQQTREKLRQAQLKLIAEGKHKGWQSRSKCKRSYAEQYVTDILNKNGIIEKADYQFEYRQNKWFIDFAFVDDKIAIEIDGKQHNYPERKIKDEEKDTWLTANGWSVHRIKWKRPSVKARQELIKELNNILKLDITDDTLNK
jgi:very-short-patch-repair endonuclease